MRCVVAVAVALAFGFAPKLGWAQQRDEPLKVSLCAIKKHPEKFLHKLVEVTVTASHGFEDSMIEDSQCPWPKSGPGIWMEYGGKRSTATIYCCGVTPKSTRNETLVVEGMRLDLLDDDEFRTFDRRLHQKPKKPSSSILVRATLRGRIFARYEGIGRTKLNPGWRGYGHMGCCMLFVVTQVVSVDPSK